ncbi:O-antigen ligase family protein [Granulosicoccus sp. 3-233]|uniref:O-antigen ligase family protein n=1 Tax=Granulosicoccus sp. 3-233 TaxID=3417969 RepID=UPI003D331277
MSQSNTRNRFRLASLCLLIAFVPLQWGRISFPGGSINIRDAGSILYILLAFAIFFTDRRSLDRRFKTILIAYLLVAVTSAVAFLSHATFNGFDLIQQCMLYSAVIYLVVVNGVKSTDLVVLGRIGALSTAVFLVLSANSMGMNFISEFVAWLTHYEYRTMLSSFYRPIFNAFSPESDDLLISGSKRNAFSMSLLLIMYLLAFGFFQLNQKKYAVLDFMLFLFLLLLVMTMFARSAILIMFLSVVIYILVRRDVTRGAIIRLVIYGSLGAGLLLLLMTNTDFGEIIYERIFLDSYSYEYRLGQIDEFFDAISGNYLTGVGFYISYSGNTLHNFFLGNWAHAGILGLLAVCLMYWFVFLQFLSVITAPRLKILAMLFLPFFIKSLVGGNAGFPELSVLLAMAIALAVQSNTLRAEGLVSRSRTIKRRSL